MFSLRFNTKQIIISKVLIILNKLFYILNCHTWLIWFHSPNDNIISDHIKRLPLLTNLNLPGYYCQFSLSHSLSLSLSVCGVKNFEGIHFSLSLVLLHARIPYFSFLERSSTSHENETKSSSWLFMSMKGSFGRT